jgi:hypothetical protein
MKPELTRKCTDCKIVKPIDDFYRDRSSKAGRSYSCKQCAMEYQRKYNRENRQKVTDASREKRRRIKETLVGESGGKCVACGYNRYIGNLHFHHRDPSKKEFHVSSTGINKARREASKCILICSNCHGEFHAGLITIPHQ